MRYKAWPFYNDWLNIFGKDRATGSTSAYCADVITKLVTGGATNPPISLGDETAYNINATDAENLSHSGGETNSSTRSKRNEKRKRSSTHLNEECRDDVPMVGMMSTFFSNVHSQIGELISKVGHQHNASLARRKLFDALAPLIHLSVDKKLEVAKLICANYEWVDIFYGLTDENKAVMVEQVLEGKW